MRTTVRTQEFVPVGVQTSNVQEPKRLSKFALWRRENPDGWFTVTDWRAVNK